MLNQEHKIKGNTNTSKGNMKMKRQRLGFLTKVIFTNIQPKVKGKHGPIWFGLTLKSNQIKHFDLEIFQTGLDNGLVWSGLRLFIFIYLSKSIHVFMQIFRTYNH